MASFVFLAEIVDKEAEGKSNVKVDRVLKAAIIGVGSRGGETYGRYFMERPDMFKISALIHVLENGTNKIKREKSLLPPPFHFLKLLFNGFAKKLCFS